MKSGLFILLCLFSGNAVLTAQEPEDYLLSGDSYGYVLPEDIRIQGAGEIDSTARLVVWGTTGYNKGKDAVNILVAHINDRQFRLSGEEARPFGVVEVIPLDDRFLVLWNDKRKETPGIYGRIVTADGEIEGGEMVLAEGGKLREVITSRKVLGRTILVWNDVRGNLESAYACEVDEEGKREGKEVKMAATGIIRDDTYALLGGQLVLSLKDGERTVTAADGSPDTRTVPRNRFGLPHYHTGDSSIAVLEGHLLQFYRSLYDQLPERTVDLSPILPEKDILALSRDSIGWFVASSFVAEQNRQAYLFLHYLYFNPSDLLDTVTALKAVGTVGARSTIIGTGDTLLSVRSLQANVVQAVVRGIVTYDPPGSETTAIVTKEYTVNFTGRDRTEYPFIPFSSPSVVRTSSRDYSGITVSWGVPSHTQNLLSGIVPYKHPAWYKLSRIGVNSDTMCIEWINKASDTLCHCFSGLYSSLIDSCRTNLEWREQNSRDSMHIVTPQGLRIVLQGSAEGLFASLYAWRYKPLLTMEGESLQSIRISRATAVAGRPLGFVRNDTLFAVWEDHSLVGGSDIYGTWWKLPKRVMTERGEILVLDTAQLPAVETGPFGTFFTGAKIIGIMPNPVIGSARLAVEMRYHEGYVSVSFFDVLGREVKQLTRFIERGKHAFPLDLSGLPSGVYQVQVKTDISIDSVRLIVRQE